jgi:hypothetical protein
VPYQGFSGQLALTLMAGIVLLIVLVHFFTALVS